MQASVGGGGMVLTSAGGRKTGPTFRSILVNHLGRQSGKRRFGSIRASFLLSSRSRAPGPRRLALLAGAGAVAAAAAAAGGTEGGEEGARVPGAASRLLGWQPPFLGAWLPCPETFTFSEMFRLPSPSLKRFRYLAV